MGTIIYCLLIFEIFIVALSYAIFAHFLSNYFEKINSILSGIVRLIKNNINDKEQFAKYLSENSKRWKELSNKLKNK